MERAAQERRVRSRKRLRLPEYDYSQPGACFVTICIRGRRCDLADIVEKTSLTTTLGELVTECWLDLPDHCPGVSLDAFVVMPNHVHGVLWLATSEDPVGAGLGPARGVARAGLEPAPTMTPLTEAMRQFKTFSSRKANQLRGTPGRPFWQQGYHERVIRNDRELDAIREYIIANPARWAEDRENPFMAVP